MTPYILNIHTATETAIINLSKGPYTLQTIVNPDTKQHAAFLHTAVDSILKTEGITMKDLKAVSVTSGPGSYTGIRVGLAAAKGFCYALKIPLITYNSLELTALSTIRFVQDKDALYCPMIDARRMEVYTGVYKFNMEEVAPPSAKILEENSFRDYLEASKIIFSGSGIKKFQQLSKIDDTHCFCDVEISTEAMTMLSWEHHKKSGFENISFAEPLYLKEFYTTLKKI
ncbi:MAG: tRNA (adenosine(37)-N6)-threonylcarbamoyltransferase complex dimerization subunit type 1 TsaB [Ginsengibacter sp.]